MTLMRRGHVSAWQRCDSCRKVRAGDEFDDEATTCRSCLTAPEPVVRKKATPVVRTRTAPRPAAAPAEPSVRRPLLGSIGSGDLEVRERRARRAAAESLSESHPEEFGLLLRDARQAEGLRPLSTSGPASGPSSTTEHDA